MKGDITVVTVSTGAPIQNYYTYREFFLSLARWDVQPLVLEAIQGINWSGLGSKTKILYRAIKDGTIQTKYLLVVDCWDLVFTHSPHRILKKKLFVYGDAVVFSAEKNCFPDDVKEQYDAMQTEGSYKYLNSGLIIGETKDILAILEAMELHNVPEDYRLPDGNMVHINDQSLYQHIFLKQPIPMKLDNRQLLSQTMHEVSLDELDLSGEFIQNKETKSFPCTIHFNGNSKTSGVREPILKHLNLL